MALKFLMAGKNNKPYFTFYFLKNPFAMKKNHLKKATALLAVVFCLLLTPKANAQFAFGVEVSGNAVHLDKIDIHNMEGGFDLGIFARFGHRFFVQPEITYSFRSVDFKNIRNEFSENYALHQHFINIPVLLSYSIVNNKNFKFRIFAGPRVGILLNNTLLDNPSFEMVNKHLQWGGQAGLGFDFWRFTLDGRYDLAADKTSTNGETARVQNMFIATLGFKIFR